MTAGNRRPPQRVCIVHIGTHKTATTSLQLFCYENKEQLRSAGVHVCEAGRYGTLPGNHSMAWDLLENPRSRYLSDVLADLTSAPSPAALLTSEDFSLLHARPDSLQGLREALDSAGYRAIILAYLRPQAPFAESMYAERVKHNHVRALPDYLSEIFETGSYRPGGTKIHLLFEYSRLLRPFADAFGKENLVVRPYASNADPLQAYQDFLSVLASVTPDFADAPVRFQVAAARANESLTFVQLLYTAYAALAPDRARSPEVGNELIAMVRGVAPDLDPNDLAARFSLLTREETIAFLRRFSGDNDVVAREYGAALPFANEDQVPAPGDPRWRRTQVQRTIWDRLLDRWINEASAG